MRITLTAIKADVGSIGGHITPGEKLVESVEETISYSSLLINHQTFCTGDDIAILMTHTRGADDEKIHKLAWDAFKKASGVAADLGLYGAGQDLLVSAFSGNVKGARPAAAEMEFDEREVKEKGQGF